MSAAACNLGEANPVTAATATIMTAGAEISRAVTAMAHLMEDAMKTGRGEDAEYISGTIMAVTAAAGLPEWMGLSAAMDLAEAGGDTERYNSLLARLKASLNTPWDPASSPVYSYMSAAGVNGLTARMLDIIERDGK